MVQFTLDTYLTLLEGINMKFLKCACVTGSVILVKMSRVYGFLRGSSFGSFSVVFFLLLFVLFNLSNCEAIKYIF